MPGWLCIPAGLAGLVLTISAPFFLLLLALASYLLSSTSAFASTELLRREQSSRMPPLIDVPREEDP